MAVLGAAMPDPGLRGVGGPDQKHRVAIDASPGPQTVSGTDRITNTKIRVLTRIAFGFRSPKRSSR